MRLVVLFLTAVLVFLPPPTARSAIEIGFFADTEGHAGTLEMPFGTPVDVYVLAFDVPDLRAVEFGFTGSLVDDPAVLFLSEQLLGNPICLETCCWENNCFWGTPSCVAPEPGVPVVLARFTLFAGAPLSADRTLCVTGADPSSFPDGAPGLATCAQEPVAFGLASNPCGAGIADGCLVVNPDFDCDVVTDARSSFGAVKSLYRK